MAWGGILTPVKKRDSLEVCAGGILGSGGNQRRGREVVPSLSLFSFFFKLPGLLEICLWPGNNQVYLEESWYVSLCVGLQPFNMNYLSTTYSLSSQ